MSTDPIAELRSAVSQAARALRDGEPSGPEPTLDRPAEARAGRLQLQRGDAARRAAGRKPARRRRPARRPSSSAQLGGESGSVERIEVAGPGFVNLFLADAWYRRAMAAARRGGRATSARRRPTSPERILVEFVSANPTGPLHVGGGRHAAYGDSLVRLLEAVGHEVEREYYVNDAGGQIERFAALDRRPHDRRRAARGRLQRRLRRRARRARSPPRAIDPADTEAVGVRGVELDPRARAGDPRALRRPLRHLVLRARPLPPAARSSRRWPSSSSAATPTAARTRSGCARPSSATTRTGS